MQADLEGLIPDDQPIDLVQMIENYNTFKRREVQPTQANVTQNPDDWRDQQDFLKSSGDVNEIVTHQDRRLAELARQGKAQVGPIETEVVGVNQSLFDTVNDIAETYDNAVSDAYRSARESSPDAKNIKLDGFMNKLKQSAGDEGASGNIISSIKGELKNRGVGSGWRAEGRIDVDSAEKIRQKLNQLYANTSTTGLGKEIIYELKEALDNDVADIVGEDIFLDARMAKQKFHEVLSRDKVNKWEKNSDSLVNKILTGRVDSDKIYDQVLKSSPQDFDDLKHFYLNRSGDAGINAWNNLKGQVFQTALDKATSGAQRGDATGAVVSQFNGRAFENYFKPLRTRSASKKKGDKETRFDSMFSPDERELIDDIIEISRLRRPNPSNPQGSGPSGFQLKRVVDNVIKGTADKVPVLGGYIEKRGIDKAQSSAKASEEAFAYPDVLTKSQQKTIKKGEKGARKRSKKNDRKN